MWPFENTRMHWVKSYLTFPWWHLANFWNLHFHMNRTTRSHECHAQTCKLTWQHCFHPWLCCMVFWNSGLSDQMRLALASIWELFCQGPFCFITRSKWVQFSNVLNALSPPWASYRRSAALHRTVPIISSGEVCLGVYSMGNPHPS